MTPKAKEFIEHNKQFAVIAAECLTEGLQRIYGNETVAACRFVFENRSVRTLSTADSQSMPAPRWLER